MRYRWLMGLGILVMVICWVLGYVTMRMNFVLQLGQGLGALLFGYGLLWMPFQSNKVKMWCKAVRVLSYVGAGMVIVSFVIIQGLIWQAAEGERYEGNYLIVLGAGVYGETPSLSLISRLDVAVDYLNDHSQCMVVVSGGQGPGEAITEAEAMARYLGTKGIASQRIILEDESTSTWENLSYSRGILMQHNISLTQPIGVISNEFHLYRVKQLSNQLGINAVTLAAPTPQVNGLPWVMAIREYLAIIKMSISNMIAPIVA